MSRSHLAFWRPGSTLRTDTLCIPLHSPILHSGAAKVSFVFDCKQGNLLGRSIRPKKDHVLLTFFLLIGLIAAYPNGALGQEPTLPSLVEKYRQEAEAAWEPNIRRLEEKDRTVVDPKDALLLIGSSSFALWDDAASDLAPYPIINRGFGGSRFSDVAFYAERLICPHQFRAMLLFVANDVVGKASDKTPEEVAALAGHIVSVARKHQPEAAIIVIEVTPTPSRFDVYPQIRQVNAALRELCLTTPNTYFLPTAESYLDSQDRPRKELFRDDQLHQNRIGYAIWSGLIRQKLEEVWDTNANSSELTPATAGRKS